MEHAQWVECQQNPNPNFNPNSSHIQAPNYLYNFSSAPNQPTAVDPHNAMFQLQVQPPGVDPSYVPTLQYVTPPAAVNYAQQPVVYEPQQNGDAATVAYYYPDPSVNWAAAISQIGGIHYAAPQGASTPNLTNQLLKKYTRKKKFVPQGPKKTKFVQSAWCEVCKIDCNSQGVLDNHRLGRKHLKNIEKLKAKLTTTTAPTVNAAAPVIIANHPAAVAASTSFPVSAIADKPMIGPQENPDKSNPPIAQKSRKKSASRDDLETKRRRVLEGGADAGSLHACQICNVVCNSLTVFNYHLAGQKHASMIKKQAHLNAGAALAM